MPGHSQLRVMHSQLLAPDMHGILLGSLADSLGGYFDTVGQNATKAFPLSHLLGHGNDGAVTGAEVLNDADSIASTFVWHVTPFDFVNSVSFELPNFNAGRGVYPATNGDTIFAPLRIPILLKGKKIVIDQITVAYSTDASGDDFDLALLRNDNDGTTTVDLNVADIGNGTTGAQTTTLLSSSLTLADYAYWLQANPNNTDTNTDVVIYDIKFEGHIA